MGSTAGKAAGSWLTSDYSAFANDPKMDTTQDATNQLHGFVIYAAPALQTARRHRWLTPLLHGPALPQHLHRRPLLSSPLEWISRQDMEKSAETIVELVKVWEERAGV